MATSKKSNRKLIEIMIFKADYDIRRLYSLLDEHKARGLLKNEVRDALNELICHRADLQDLLDSWRDPRARAEFRKSYTAKALEALRESETNPVTFK